MTDGSRFPVRLEVFEGPLDLLLTLIRRESLDITAVALAQVTAQYLQHLARLQEIDAGAMAAFCEVAATLIVLKSRALLPLTAGSREELELDADAEELVERLRAYRQLRDAAESLGQRERAGLRAYSRAAPPPDIAPQLKAGDVTVADLLAAMEEALTHLLVEEAPRDAGGLRPHPVLLADRLADIREMLVTRGFVTFREALTGDRRDREFIIVSFLAVLELLRRRAITARQDALFGEIVLEWRPGTETAGPPVPDETAGPPVSEETAGSPVSGEPGGPPVSYETGGPPRRRTRRSARRASPALVFALALWLLPQGLARAQARRPFDLPFAGASSLGTWYVSQPYGNTIYGYYERQGMYASAQGMHMGIDLAAPCGTEVLAIGDGTVRSVDGPGGAAPHNLMLAHDNGYISFYGHLLQRPALSPGQRVTRGQVVALSGDMLGTCSDSPHLHLEIRDASAARFENPVTLIEADWHSLLLLGSGGPVYERDLDDPRRWQQIDDQPALLLGGPLLNDYPHSWPNADQ